MNDVRLAFRQLLKNPGFAIVAILTLALGIGANTAIFSVVYAVVLRPLPFPDSERLVAIWTQTPQVDRLRMGAANHRDLKSQSVAFEDIALLRNVANYNLTGDGEPERLLASRISANLLSLLRAKPLLGRSFTEDETQPGRDNVAILGFGLWQRRYGGDPNIIGKTILLEHYPHLVLGVMGPDFRYPSTDVQIWTPLTINPADFQNRTGYHHLCVARLKPGFTVAQAQAEVNLIATRLTEEHPQPNKDVRFSVTALRNDIASVAQKPLIVLLGAALGLLLIGCCNLVNLLFARTLSRSRENAIRTALGATGSRLVQQAAVELAPILLLGSVLGILSAEGCIQALLPWLPSALPRIEEIQVNLPVLLFSAAILLVTAALVLILPARQAAAFDLVTTLREDARTSSGTLQRTNVRNLLVVGQVALTVILLSGAGLLIRSFAALRDVNPGFRSEGVLTLRLAIPRNKYGSDGEVAAFCQRLLQAVRTLPGIDSAGMVHRLPPAGSSGLSTIEFQRSDQTSAMLVATDDIVITPDYFRAMGIALLRGQSFTERDTTNAPSVVIVDEQVARLAWPGENPIGKRLRSNPENPWAEVVGVVAHVRHESLESNRRLQIYWNYLQHPRDRMAMVVHTAGEPRQVINPVLAALKAIDPDQPAYAVRTLTDAVDESLALRWFNTVVVSLFAGASLLLAMIGIYGVIAWTARSRTREIGVRMALGAKRSAVLRLILRNGLGLVSAGVAIGLVGAILVSRLLRSLLFEITPTDPTTFLTVPALLITVGLLACWLPARRAARINPIEALRYE